MKQYNKDQKNKDKISTNLRSSFKDKLKGTIVLTRDNSRQPVPTKKGGSPDCFPIISYGTLQTFAGSLSVVVGLHFTAASIAVASAAVASTLLSLAGPIGAGVICVGLMVVLGGYLYCKYSGAKDDEKQGYDIENVPLPPPLNISPINISSITKVVNALIGQDKVKESDYKDKEINNSYQVFNWALQKCVPQYVFQDNNLNVAGWDNNFYEYAVIVLDSDKKNKSLNDYVNNEKSISKYNEQCETNFIYEVSLARKLLPILWYTKKEFEISWTERLFGKTKKGGKTPSRLPYEKRLKQDLYKLAVSRKLEVTKKTTKSDLIQLLRK